jgi:hypothetical protein
VTNLSASGLAGSTVRQAYGVLSLVLSLAVRDRRIASNPADGVKLPRKARSEKRFLTSDEVARLAGEAGPHRVAVLLLAYTGLRFGELAALRARRIDLMRRRLEIAESVSEVNGAVVFTTPNLPPCWPAEPRTTLSSLHPRAGSSAAMTLDVYAGLFEDGLDDVADRLDAVARGGADRLRTGAAGMATVRPLIEGKTAGQTGWGGWGSNPRPTGYEPAALTG